MCTWIVAGLTFIVKPNLMEYCCCWSNYFLFVVVKNCSIKQSSLLCNAHVVQRSETHYLNSTVLEFNGKNSSSSFKRTKFPASKWQFEVANIVRKEMNAYQLIHHLRFLRIASGHVLWMQSRRKCECIKRRNIVFVHSTKIKYFCLRENVSYVCRKKVIDNCNNLFRKKYVATIIVLCVMFSCLK